MKNKIEFGDFQTPYSLALRCTSLISEIYTPRYIIEPTCGTGTFLVASYKTWGKNPKLYGYEINKNYIEKFKSEHPNIYLATKVKQANLFELDLNSICNICSNPLILGNPPWVTNSQLGVLNSSNVPQKSNYKNFSGFEALSGKSNFDISEWMIAKFSSILRQKKGILAMLCKSQVARNIFVHNNDVGFKNVGYNMFKIDSKKEFGVSVDACLFIIDFLNGGDESKCNIYDDIDFNSSKRAIGIYNKKLIADIDNYINLKDSVEGNSFLKWRSGVKHDAAKIMELKRINNIFINGYGDKVDIEDEYVFPLLKSSDLANNRLTPKKYIIITQKKLGEETTIIKNTGPKLWEYLLKYSDELCCRKSSIYKKQPRFAIFGVGEYSFQKYKIAISGLYKKLNFCLLSSHNNKPIILDDTCYSIGFENYEKAKECFNYLCSEVVIKYISSLVFFDAKRPINTTILNSIKINKNFISKPPPKIKQLSLF